MVPLSTWKQGWDKNSWDSTGNISMGLCFPKSKSWAEKLHQCVSVGEHPQNGHQMNLESLLSHDKQVLGKGRSMGVGFLSPNDGSSMVMPSSVVEFGDSQW